MLFKKLRRDLFIHKGPFLAVAILVFLGVAIFGASYDSYQNLNNSYAETHRILNFADYNFQGGPFTTTDTQQVAQVVGVKEAISRTVTELAAQIPDGSKVTGRMVGVPVNNQPLINKLKIIQGNYLASSHGILIEKHFYEAHHLKTGDKVNILGQTDQETFTVAGEAVSAEYIWPARSRQDILPSMDNFGVFFIPQTSLEKLVGTETNNEIVVRFDSRADQEKTVAQVTSVLGVVKITDAFGPDKVPSNEALKEDLDGFQEIAFLFPFLFLIVASMSIYVSLSRLIHAQRPQIGVLRANGYSSSSILLHYVSFGAVIALLGSLPGVVVGLLLARAMTTFYTSMLSIPVVEISFYPVTVAIGIILAAVFSLVAALLPARSATKIAPAEAMRGETPSSGRRSIFESLLPFMKNFSPSAKLPFRNISRNRRRSFSTILGVVLSFILLMAAWGMLDTIELMLQKQFQQVQKQDFTLAFNAPVGEAQIQQVKDVKGVTSVEPVFIAPIVIEANGKKYSTQIFGVKNGTQMHTFFTENNKKISAPSNSLYAGLSLKKELGIKEGDAVKVSVPEMGLEFEEKISNFLNEPLGTIVYGNYQNIMSKTSSPGTVAVLVKTNTSNRKWVSDQFSNLNFVAAVDDSKALQTTINQLMALFYGMVGVMLAFGALMAAALMFNTMTVNITERTRELVTMLTIGYSRSKIVLLILAENLVLVTIALIPGLITGYFVSDYFMSAFNTDIFRMDFNFKISSFIFIIVLIYVIGVVSQIPALLTIRKFKLAEIIRERIS